MEFFSHEDLRYGYFWPYPNMPRAEVFREPSLEDVDREMDGRDTIREMPVFAMVVNDAEPVAPEAIENILTSFDDISPLSAHAPETKPAPAPTLKAPRIIAHRIIMLSEDPNGQAKLLAEIDDNW
jgi:hypothetical protein